MLYMFSFFALSSIVLGGVISVVLVILIILEVCVSALQASFLWIPIDDLLVRPTIKISDHFILCSGSDLVLLG